MDKKALIIHRVLVGLCLFCFVWEFVFYLANWSSLPEEPGIHFGPDGTFDVYASKIFGFYPHVISLIVLAVHFFVSFVISREKLQLGVNITEKGKRMFLGSLMITVDLVVLSVLLCFCCWVFAVSAQNENIMGLTPNIIFSAGLMIAFCAVIFQCIVCAVYSEKPETEEEFSPAEKRKRLLRLLLTGSTTKIDRAVFLRLSRICSWISVGIILFIMLFTLERLPIGDITDAHHGLAWLENLGGYYSKWMVFLPYIVFVPVMLLLELASFKAAKKGKNALVTFCSRLRLIFAGFSGWWEILIFSELAIGTVSFSIFAVLCAVTVILYFIDKKNELPVKEEEQQ